MNPVPDRRREPLPDGGVISEPAEILDRVSDAFYALDDEWRFQYVNEEAERILKQSADELLGRRIWDEFPEAAEGVIWDKYHEAMETQRSVTFELFYEPLDTWANVSAYPSETGLSVYFRDVSERKARERALEESRRRYATLVEHIPNGAVALFDHDLRILLVGGTVFDELALTSGEIEGRTVREVFDAEVAETLETHYRAVLGGESRTFTLSLDDEIRRLHAVPIPDDADGVQGGMVISQDITEQVRRERELQTRSRQQEVVATLARRALENPPLSELFDLAVEGVAEALDHDYCKVLNLLPGEEQLLLRSGVGWREGYVGEATVANDRSSQAGYTLLAENPVVVEDLASETRFTGPDLLVDHGVVSGISTIIGSTDDPWGILGTHDTETQSYTEDDVEFVQSVANILSTAIDRERYERELREQRERLAALNDLNSLVQQLSESVVRQSSRAEIERQLCEGLADSESYVFAWLGEVDPETDTIVVRTEAGVEDYLADIDLSVSDDPGRTGPTVTALRTGEVQVVQDVEANPDYEAWRDHAAAYGYRSSAAIPISFRDEQYGVLNVYSDRPAAFGAEERATFTRLGTIAGHALRSVERDRRLRESERRYRTLAENIPNGAVTLVDENLEYVLVAGSNYERFDFSPSEIEGESVEDLAFLPSDLRERVVDAFRAALDGETTVMELEYEGRTYEFRTVPVRDGDEISAAMSLSQDITEHKRRQAELEHERERLELMNRLIRHNLLNSLNVVDARLSMLEPHVDEDGRSHLETARKRTGGMVNLVETIRAVMRALVETDEFEVEPVSLDDVLANELEVVRQSFPDAEFACHGPADVTVLANQLLNEVVENLLVNAVQHNDRETPRVEVTVEPGADTVDLVVSDNGPGVPEEFEAEIFEKGTRGFESPGTGFGLHLVREIVEAYGGDVSVTNRDESDEGRGATFRVSLRRA
jgi:PAS domain S-box-containing protein